MPSSVELYPVGEQPRGSASNFPGDCGGLEVIAASSGSTAGRLDIVIVNYETPDLVDDSSSFDRRTCTGDPGASHRRRQLGRSPSRAESVVRRSSNSSRLVRPAPTWVTAAAPTTELPRVRRSTCSCSMPTRRLHDGAVEALVGELDRHPEAGIVGPRLVDSDRSCRKPSCARFPTPGRLVVARDRSVEVCRGRRGSARAIQPVLRSRCARDRSVGARGRVVRPAT